MQRRQRLTLNPIQHRRISTQRRPSPPIPTLSLPNRINHLIPRLQQSLHRINIRRPSLQTTQRSSSPRNRIRNRRIPTTTITHHHRITRSRITSQTQRRPIRRSQLNSQSAH
jgi:hypothetical protein